MPHAALPCIALLGRGSPPCPPFPVALGVYSTKVEDVVYTYEAEEGSVYCRRLESSSRCTPGAPHRAPGGTWPNDRVFCIPLALGLHALRAHQFKCAVCACISGKKDNLERNNSLANRPTL